MREENSIELLNLPKRFNNKLISDIERIEKYNIPGLLVIILFGSCARNEMKLGSDIDLMIVTEGKITDRFLKGELRCDLDEYIDNTRTDIVFTSKDWFYNVNNPLMNEVRKDGIIIRRYTIDRK